MSCIIDQLFILGEEDVIHPHEIGHSQDEIEERLLQVRQRLAELEGGMIIGGSVSVSVIEQEIRDDINSHEILERIGGTAISSSVL